ncbi:MAG: hypothetical protein ABII76_08745 [Pseudomonadota bacterium]
MTVGSTFSASGLTVQVYRPDIAVDASTTPYTVVYAPKGTPIILAANNRLAALQWTKTAVGGYDSCALQLVAGPQEFEQWLDQAIGAHVEIVDQAQVLRWEGVITDVTATMGGLAWRWGPLTSIANRVAVLYNVEDRTTTPPTTGERVITDWAEAAASQRLYGARVAVLNSSGLSDAEAEAYRDMWLRESRRPALASDVNLGGAGDQFGLQISAKGYWHLLDYPYNQTTNTGEQDLSDKIADVLDADPNGLVSSANAEIATNTIQVEAYEHDYRRATDLLQAMVRLGDAAYNRYTLRVGPNRRVVYAEVPENVAYQVSMTQHGYWQVRDIVGGPVRPWEIEPGRWAMLGDVRVGTNVPADREAMQDDPRYLFIEQVSFTAPGAVVLRSGRASSVEAALGQWGLGEA